MMLPKYRELLVFVLDRYADTTAFFNEVLKMECVSAYMYNTENIRLYPVLVRDSQETE